MGLLQTTITKRKNPVSGEKLMYPDIVCYSNVNDQALIDYMVESCQVSRIVAMSAVAAFSRLIKNYVLNGHTVKIPSLGTFRLSCRAKAQTSADKVTAKTIKNLHIVFTPAPATSNAAKSVRFRGLIPEDNELDIIVP